ncbi:hypothetical protein Hanom_Chr07g00643581 [Helianthus anomalus]
MMKNHNKFKLNLQQSFNHNIFIHLLTNHQPTNFNFNSFTDQHTNQPKVVLQFASLRIVNVKKFVSVCRSVVCKDRW